MNPNNGRKERIFVNLEAVYPTPDQLGTEVSFEELRAQHRGWTRKVWQPESPDLVDCAETSDVLTTELSRLSMNNENSSKKISLTRGVETLDENGQTKDSNRKPRRMKIKEVNETQISRLIPLFLIHTDAS